MSAIAKTASRGFSTTAQLAIVIRMLALAGICPPTKFPFRK